MDPAAVVHICRLDDVRRQQPLGKEDSDSSSAGNALLGRLRVVNRTELLATEPFHLPAGCIVLTDLSGAQIRCTAANPHPMWFEDSIHVLLPHWRYIPPSPQLSGMQRTAWAHIEVLSDPVLLPSHIGMPKSEQLYSWWAVQQIALPDTAHQIQSAIRTSPPLSVARAARVLERTRRSSSNPKTEPAHSSYAIYGRVDAMGSLLATASDDIGFLVRVAVESSANEPMSCLSVLLVGERFLGLFASLRIDNYLFVDHLWTQTLLAGSDHSQAIFITSLGSEAFHIDDSTDLVWGDLPPTSQRSSHFTQTSQNMLLSQVTDSSQQKQQQQQQSVSGPKSEQVLPGPPSNIWRDPHLFVNQGRLEGYAGVITRVVDPVLGIYIIDECHALILTYWPPLSPLNVLRTGTRILVENAHILLLSNSPGYQWEWIKRLLSGDSAEPSKQHLLVFGACVQTSVRILEFATTDEPAAMVTAIDSAMAPVLAKQAQGLVQMIETAEAYWKLGQKFPHGMVGNYDSQTDAKQVRRELLAAAMRWAGVPTASSVATESRNLTAEFLVHEANCRAEKPRSHFPTRIVPLSSVASRFIEWSRVNQPDLLTTPMASNSNSNSNSSNDNGTDDGLDLDVCHISPEDLQQTTTALAGWLTMDSRGSLYLADATGRIRVHPDASCIGDTHRVLFPGQALIGHAAAWMKWQFSVERVARHGVNPFELVYVTVSSPVLLQLDTSFGRAISSDPLQSSADCFLVAVHARGNAAPVDATRSIGLEGTAVGGVSRSMRYIAKGIAVPVGYRDALEILRSLDCGSSDPVDLGTAAASAVLRCLVTVDFAHKPVLLAPGSAYLICARSKTSLQYVRSSNTTGRHEPALLITPESHDPVVPVQAEFVTAGSPLEEHPRRTVCAAPFIVDASTEQVHLPAVRQTLSSAASSMPLDLATGSRVFSVAEILLATGACSPGSLVSVRGIVADRSVTNVVFLEPLLSGQSVAAGDSALSRPVSGVFSNRLMLSDEDSPEQSISVYLKFASFSHPLAVVQGARFVIHDLVVNVSQARKSVYLSGTLSTFVQAIAQPLQQIEPTPTPLSDEQQPVKTGVTGCRCCIGELYSLSTADLAQRLELFCQIFRFEYVNISAVCRTCKQRVCAMRCSCPSRRHKLTSAAPDQTATVLADACCWVTDGSGIACLVLSRKCDIAAVLDIPEVAIDNICHGAAQSWNGQFMWNPQADQSPVSAAIDRATASANRLHVVGRVEATPYSPQAIRQQPLRLNRQNVLVNQQTPPRITARSVAKITTLAMCCTLLNDIGNPM